jgi:negative regulator of sigma E activity
MALTSNTDSPSPITDTRGTEAANLNATHPRAPWFELRPWHYVVSFASTAGVTAAVVIVVLTHAAMR